MRMHGRALLVVIAAGLLAAMPALAAPPQPFPDVPPWHWAYQAVTKDGQAGLFIGYPATPAELVENSIRQVYAGFTHAQAPGARAWVERFTYDLPANWPTPLEQSRLAAFSLGALSTVVTGDTATATFTAAVTLRTGAAQRANPMHVRLQLTNGDWKVNYADLAAQSPLFR